MLRKSPNFSACFNFLSILGIQTYIIYIYYFRTNNL